VPPHVHYFKCDLASPAEIRYIAAGVSQQVGPPTILINNAGFARGNTILSTSETDLKLTFQINTLSHYHLAQAFLPAMIQSNHGMVVTVASLAAYVTSPGLVDYSASKAAALAFHEGLQVFITESALRLSNIVEAELATILNAPKVRSVVICQGYTRTALFEGFHQGDFINYPLHPETVAEEIVRAVLRGQSDHILLPRANSYIANLRGWPHFLQGHARKDLKKMMKNWRGRQVEQPSEASGSNDGSMKFAKNGKELEASAVLL
jgi:all-trans-retinol dehydrogenase (NAD+)